MLVYNVLALLSLILRPMLKDKALYMGIMCLLLVLVAGGRALTVGSDTVSYALIYDNMKNISWEDAFGEANKIEIGNTLIIFLSRMLYDSPHTFIFLMSFFTIAALMSFIYRTAGEDYHIATFIILTFGFYFYLMNAERQALGIAICCHAVYYMFHHSYMKALLICLLASCFHLSLLIVIPVIVVLKLFDRDMGHKMRLAALIFSCVAVLGLFYYGYNIFLDRIDLLEGRFTSYLSVLSEYNDARAVGKFYGALLCTYFSIAIFLNLVRTHSEQQRKNFIVGFLLVIAVVFMFAQVNIMYIFYRFVDTFSVYLCLGVPFAFRIFKNSYYKDFILLLFFFMALIVMNYMGVNNLNEVYPYAFAI